MATGPAEISDAAERLSATRAAHLHGAWPNGTRLSRADLEPHTRRIGITRVADLTGLDVLGVPVWAAMRPGSRSLCVSAGRGTTHDQAWTSAVLESAEQALAEDAAALVSVVCSPAELARRSLRSVPLELQSRCAARWLPPDHDLAWVKGLSWKSGEWVYAPYELVGMDMTTDAPWNTKQFRMTSAGLASGADLAGAIEHGVAELVEDDAMFAAVLATAGVEDDLTFDPGRGEDLRSTIDDLSTLGVEVRFAKLRCELGPAVVVAALFPGGTATDQASYYCGSACDVSIERAALSALQEAVQCRAIFISGTRDDLFANEYVTTLGKGTRCFFERSETRWQSAPPAAGLPAGPAKAFLQSGLGDFYVFPLGGRQFGFEAVRVLADNLVSMLAPANYARSGRAASVLLQRWGQA